MYCSLCNELQDMQELTAITDETYFFNSFAKLQIGS